MMGEFFVLGKLKQLAMVIFGAGLMVVVSLVMLQLSVQAGVFNSSGAGGCGTFLGALNAANNDDIIVQMIPEKTTEGATITKNIIVQGGWLPTSNCAEANQIFTTTADLFAAGFQFQAPQERSILFHNDDSVLKIDSSVMSVTLQHLELSQRGNTTPQGGGISGIITDGAEVYLENLLISNSEVVSRGGGIYFEVRGGSKLVISDSLFISNTVTQGLGGGFEIWVYDNSHLIIHNTQILSNVASGAGSGGRIMVESGFVTITESIFRGNQASSQTRNPNRNTENALVIESIGNNDVQVYLNNNTFTDGYSLNGDGIHIVGGNNFNRIFLPFVGNNAIFTKFVQITDITISNNSYRVEYTPYNYEPQLPGEHIHFFFDTVSPDEAGLPGNPNNWKIYAGPSPFLDYMVSDRPTGASKLCALVANSDHTIQLGSGNCFDLP